MSSGGYVLEVWPASADWMTSPAAKKAANELEAQYGGNPFGLKIFKL